MLEHVGDDTTATAIRAMGLTKRYGATTALAGLDLSVRKGEVYGFLGPNGAGKTTTIRLLLGLHRPTSGHPQLFGQDAFGDPVGAHRRVAYVAGEPGLWPALTAAETFELLAGLRQTTDIGYRHKQIDRFELDIGKRVRAPARPFRDGPVLVMVLIGMASVGLAVIRLARRDLVTSS